MCGYSAGHDCCLIVLINLSGARWPVCERLSILMNTYSKDLQGKWLAGWASWAQVTEDKLPRWMAFCTKLALMLLAVGGAITGYSWANGFQLGHSIIYSAGLGMVFLAVMSGLMAFVLQMWKLCGYWSLMIMLALICTVVFHSQNL